MSSSKLIYSKRYGESEFFKGTSKGSSQSSKGTLIAGLKNAENCKSGKIEGRECSRKKRDFQSAVRFEADTVRIKKSKRFVSMAEDFSQKHKVSADIFRGKCCIDVWLYFSTEIITAERKKELLKLIGMGDELMIIPHPRGMPEWCDYSLVLTYMTHRLIIR